MIKDAELVIFQFSKKLEIGIGKLNIINYNGTLNDDMIGFYRVKYNHKLCKNPYTVTTQFEVYYG